MKIIVANIHLKEYMSSEFNSNFFFLQSTTFQQTQYITGSGIQFKPTILDFFNIKKYLTYIFKKMHFHLSITFQIKITVPKAIQLLAKEHSNSFCQILCFSVCLQFLHFWKWDPSRSISQHSQHFSPISFFYFKTSWNGTVTD